MKTICFVVFFLSVSYFVEASGEESTTVENVEVLTHMDGNEVKAEHNSIQDSKYDANKNKSCECGKNANCSIINGKKTCTCFHGYSMYEGTCMKCDCRGKWEKCSFTKGIYQKRTCTCERGYAVERCTGLFCNDTCAVCDCGKNGNCSFGTNGKNCSCDKGFALNNGKCEVCDCGKNGNCSFVRNGKNCSCDKGFALNNGKCEVCLCGAGGTCSFKGGKKTCNCSSGYAETHGRCAECRCGGSFKSCSFETSFEVRKCVCNDGYAVNKEKYWPYHETCYECNCGANAACEFNYFGDKVCKCQPGFEEVNGKCQKPCDCGVNGKCKIINGVKTCTCASGFSEYRGFCRSCQCGYGTCSFSSHGMKECDCYAGSVYVISDEECVACDCGRGSTNCWFDYWRKRYCSCKDGFFAQRDTVGNQYCKECDCGKGGNCTISFGEKKCLCNEGLKEVNGKCQECDCGTQTLSCKLDNQHSKKCTCKDGYYAHRTFTWSNDECLDCNCGFYSSGCYINGQNDKICKCQYGSFKVDSSKRCKDCDCGVGSKSCFFTLTGKRQCICSSGYEKESVYNNGDSCRLRGSGPTSGWKIATFVVSVLIVVIIIGMLIVIADRRSFRRRMRTQQR